MSFDDYDDELIDDTFEQPVPVQARLGESEMILRQTIDIIVQAPSVPLSSSPRVNRDEIVELLQDALERAGQTSRVMSAIEMPKVAEPYIRRRAERHLEKGRVVILAGGTGNPFFTTDTAAALRAAEIEAQAILKGTHSGVDGVYTADPKIDKTATRYDQISHMDVITKGLKVMDATAITFCMDKKLPIVVFDLLAQGNVKSILKGEQVGTLVG